MKVKHLLILIFLFSSCNSNRNVLSEYDPTSFSGNEIVLSDIADDIRYVPLDDSIQLREINSNFNLKFIDDLIFKYETDLGILVFDMDGKLLRKIGKIGRGPGEYLHGSVFAVDPNHGTVYVKVGDSEINVYSETGAYQRSFSLHGYGGSVDVMEFYDSKLFVSYNLQYNDAKYEWILLDTLGNLIKEKKRTIPQFTSNYLAGGGTYMFKGRLNYWNQFIDTVFSILPDLTCKPAYLLKPGEYRLPKVKVADPIRQLSQYMTIEEIFETNRFITLRYSFYKAKNGFILFEKKNSKSVLISWDPGKVGGISNDLDGGLKFLPMSYLIEKNREYLIEMIDPFQLKKRIASSEFKIIAPVYPEKKKELEKLANSLKETDNPVLMMVRLKR